MYQLNLWISIVFCWQIYVHASQGQSPHLHLSDDSVKIGEGMCVPVQVDGFEDVEAFQFSINFDPHLLRLDSITNYNTDIGLDAGAVSLSDKDLGIVRVIYFDANGDHTLPDGSTLFEMCFTARGPTGELCPVNVSDHPLDIEFISNEMVIDSVTRRNARIDIFNPDSFMVDVQTCHSTFGDTTGSLTVIANGGAPPYFVLWRHAFNDHFNGGFQLSEHGDFRLISDLIEGRYRVTVTDSTGMRIRDSLNVVTRSALSYRTEIEHPLCDNSTDGSILIDSISGGDDPLQLKWSDGELFTPYREGLAPGIYDLTITDQKGCRMTDAFELRANSIQTDVSLSHAGCDSSATGSIIVVISGGQPWHDGVDSFYEVTFAGNTEQVYGIFEAQNLAPGDHPLVLSDSIGCEKSMTITINPGYVLDTGQLDVSHVTCAGSHDGAIFFQPHIVNDIEPPYYDFEVIGADSFEIDSHSIALDGLGAGPVIVIARHPDEPACLIEVEVLIEAPPALEIIVDSVTPATCIPGFDGSATISVSGGVPNPQGNYHIQWDFGQTGPSALNRNAGEYTVTVTDESGCTAELDVTIPTTQLPALIGSSSTGLLCNDSTSTGTLVTVFSSPFGIEGYLWSTGDTTSIVEDITAGNYTVTVWDGNGCSDTFRITAKPGDAPAIQGFDTDQVRCAGDSNGSIVVHYEEGGASISSISWNGMVGTDTLSDIPAGSYFVEVTDTNQCVDTATVTLIDPMPLSIDFESFPDTNDTGTGWAIAHVTGGWSPYAYQWDHPNNSMDSTMTDLLSGVYPLIITDSEGCMYMDTASIDRYSSITDLPGQETLTLFPNPTSSTLTLGPLSTPVEAGDQLSIYDQKGTILAAWKIQADQSHLQLDITSITPGNLVLVWSRGGQILASLPFVKVD